MANQASSILGDTFIQPGSQSIRDTPKRIFDLCASFIGLILLSPLFLLISLLVKREGPGPVFYRGPRIGRHGKKFNILKFRTMSENPESYQGPRITAKDDPRVTTTGRWLRDSKINELPQLWNVLVGEMSLVGPRPEDPEIAKTWPLDARQEILSVRPGVTSPASVLYHNEESLLQSDVLMDTYLKSILPSKMRLDQLYVRNRSFWLDLDTILWTLLILVPKIGDKSPAEDRLFLGPVTRLVRRYLTWFVIDLIISFCAVAATFFFWRQFGPLDVGLPIALAFTVLFALLFSACSAAFGMNRVSWSQAVAEDAIGLLPPAAVATALAVAGNYFWQHHPKLPNGLLLLAACLALFGFVAVRYRSRLLKGFTAYVMSLTGTAQGARERVLIVGGGETGQIAAWLLGNGQNARVFSVVGFADDDLFKQGVRLRGVNVLGQCNDIPRLVAKFDVGIIIFAIHNISAHDRQNLIKICASTPARIVVLPNILAALGSVVNDPEKNGKNIKPAEQTKSNNPDNLPCELCLIKLSPLTVYEWLNDLDKLAVNEDRNILRQRIRILRSVVINDAMHQLRASSSIDEQVDVLLGED